MVFEFAALVFLIYLIGFVLLAVHSYFVFRKYRRLRIAEQKRNERLDDEIVFWKYFFS